MKKNIHPAVGVVIVIVIVGVVVGLWFNPPFQPKIYGLDPPTKEQKKAAADQMKNDMISAAKEKKQVHQNTDE